MAVVTSPVPRTQGAFSSSTRRRGTREMRGRDAELRSVRELLRRTMAGAGGVLLVEGERGMGKSLLLREAADEGARQGFSLAAGAGDRLGGQLPLFALRIAVGLGGDGNESEPAAVPAQIASLRERLVRRAETAPVLVTLDDLQWASQSTLLALRVLPRALARYPIAWILARSAASRDDDPGLLFTALEREGALRADLRCLETGVVTAMLADAFGASPDDELLELAAGAGGNPSLLSYLIDGLREDQAVRVTDGRACLASARLPRRISRAVRQWFNVTEDTRRLLETTAVLGGEFQLSDVAEVMGTAPAALWPGIEEALKAGIIVAGEDTFSFRHPLLARAAAESVPQPVRRVLHHQFGEILLSREGPAAEAARHLMGGAAPGDPASLTCLDIAVARILHRSPGTAADLALRAMQCTGPADRAATPRAVAAVESLAAAGRPREAARIAHEKLAQPIAAGLEARLRCALASALNMNGQAGDAAAQANMVLSSRDPHGMRDDALSAWLQAVTVRHDERTSPIAAGLLASPDEHAGHAVVAAGTARAMLKWDEGHTAEALELLREAVRQSNGVTPDSRHSQPLLMLAARLIDLRRLDEAGSLLHPADGSGPRDGLAGLIVSLLRVRLHLARGRFDDVGPAAKAVLDAAESAGADAYASVVRSLLASVALRLGRVDEGRRHIAARTVLPPHAAAVYAPAETCLAPIQVTEASEGPSAAIGQIRELSADSPALRRVLLGDPGLPVWLVRTALADGERLLATRIAAAIETLSAPQTLAVGAAAAHARGLVAKDGDSLAHAAVHHADSWSRASAAEDLAVLHVGAEARDEAVSRLNEALEGYGKTGATADLARVRARLRGLGIRRRHWETSPARPLDGWESLTDTERAVAELVAQGLTNRRAADRMYISTHTVAHHLRQAFRKLRIGSRVELARIVLEQSQQASALAASSRLRKDGQRTRRSTAMQVNNGPASPSQQGERQYFTGEVWMDQLAAGDQNRLSMLRVHFSPGARTNWHTHPRGQILHVVDGVGRIQVRGEAVRTLRAGDTAVSPADEWHWHGAAGDAMMTMISVQGTDDDGVVVHWGEPVAG